MATEHWFDALARRLATTRSSRRTLVRRLAGGAALAVGTTALGGLPTVAALGTVGTCPAGQTYCGKNASATGCIDTTTNPRHCGACNNQCGSGVNAGRSLCVAGQCCAPGHCPSPNICPTGGACGSFRLCPGKGGFCFCGTTAEHTHWCGSALVGCGT